MKDTTDLLDIIWHAFANVSYAFFAGIGGMIFYLLGLMEAKDSPSIQWRIVLIYGLASAFVGQLVMLICRYLMVDENLTGAIVGLSGAIGARASINFMNTIIKKRFGVAFYNRRKDDRHE